MSTRRKKSDKNQVSLDYFTGRVLGLYVYLGIDRHKREGQQTVGQPPTHRDGPAVCPLCLRSDRVIHRGTRITKNRGNEPIYNCRRCNYKFANTPYARTHYPDWVVDRVLSLAIYGLPLRTIADEVKREALIRGEDTKICRQSVRNVIQRNLKIILDFELNAHLNSESMTWQIDDTPQRYTGKRKEKDGTTELNNRQVFAWITNVIVEETRYWLVCWISEGRSLLESEQAIRRALRVAKRAPVLIKCDGYKGHIRGVRCLLKHVKIVSISKDQDFAWINIIERLHRFLRAFAVKKRRTFRSLDTLKYSTELVRIYYNFFRPHETLDGETPARRAGIEYPYHEGLTWSEFIRFAFDWIRKRRHGIQASL